LRGLGLGQYEQAFRDNDVDADLLPTLTAEDLRELGVASLGHRKRLLAAIAALVPPTDPQPPAASPLPMPQPSSTGSQAERRHLTVMFVDLVGSTTLSQRLDPEEMREVIRAYQDRVAGEVLRYEGHVAKFMGDGVLAYFGWPQAHEDDAERAVRAGLAITATTARLTTPAAEPLAARIGIATGLAVVGDLVGEGAAREEAVVGETPNLAARLQEAATPGAVVVAEGTRRLLGEVFEMHPLGPTRLKGFASPTEVYRVLAERPARSRFEAHQAGGPLPMIGRDQELALVLERWRQTAAGEGQAMLLVGQAGIGKSRLVGAVLDALESEDHAALRYQCSPHHTGTAFWPVAQQLRFAAGIEPTDPEPTKLDKLKVLLRQGTDDPGEAAPLIAALLGIDADARCPVATLTPQQQRTRTLAALVGQLLGLARRRPVLMVLEDAHWIDPTTLELLGLALDRIADARVLMLLTSRPDHQPSLSGPPLVTRLALNRLGRGPTEAIVARLAGGRNLPSGVLSEIAARTDGVPLFIEELTKAVVEATGAKGADAAPVAVPASLHASLMARLDRVPDVKEVAQVAACIGREFAYPLLAAVSPTSEPELRAALDRLAAAELVFVRGVPPEASYTFKHALVRDAAYESLLKSRRRQLHAHIAAVLEERFPETAGTAPELLAHHWAEAGSPSRAVEFWIVAANRALAVAGNREAAAFLERALAALGEQKETRGTLREMIDVRRLLHQALYPVGELRRTRANLAEAERLAERLDDPVRLCRVLSSETYLLAASGDLKEAIHVGERALSLLDRGGDDLEGAVNARLMLARALYAAGRYREAIDHIRPVVETLREDVPRGQLGPGLNQTINARVWHMLCLAELGEFTACAALATGVQRLAARMEDAWQLENQVWLRIAVGRAAVLQGDFVHAVEVLEPALASSESEFAIYYSRVASSLGIAHARLGDPERGLALLREAVSRDRTIGFGFRFGLLLAQLGEALLLAGDVAGALDTGTQALEAARNVGEKASEAWSLHLLGDVAAKRHLPGAEAYYREALDVAERLAMVPLKARCLEGLGRLTGACSAVVVNYPG
jgi:class 3 adenylate cyclase/tetratricopeptide (TPR) repeat protein